jgi:hypothetical protein
MFWWLTPPRPPRRTCGAAAALQAAVFTVAVIALVVLVMQGTPAALAGPIVGGLLALAFGRSGPEGGTALPERVA